MTSVCFKTRADAFRKQIFFFAYELFGSSSHWDHPLRAARSSVLDGLHSSFNQSGEVHWYVFGILAVAFEPEHKYNFSAPDLLSEHQSVVVPTCRLDHDCARAFL